ncbi:MAG: hypothetical protein JWM36_1421 [Hyphomicrobiales bacterium]|nr:hypothetical protein [Hyphomicrobiales bacterium]
MPFLNFKRNIARALPRLFPGSGYFRRDTRGAAALEFAIVGLPFFAVVFVVLEVAVDFQIYAELDTSLQKAAADIRSGTVQMQSMTAEQFKSQILCPRLPGLSCSSILLTAATISNPDLPWYGNADQWNAWEVVAINPGWLPWCPGGSGDVVLLQMGYPVPLASMIWAGTLKANGSRYYVSTVALRNDPFGVPVSAAGC